MLQEQSELPKYAERLKLLLDKTQGKKMSDAFYDGVNFANKLISGKTGKEYPVEAIGVILDTLEAMNV
jgi:hypothetical protein